MAYASGVDVGSTQTKAVILDESRRIVGRSLMATGANVVTAAQNAFAAALEQASVLESAAPMRRSQSRREKDATGAYSNSPASSQDHASRPRKKLAPFGAGHRTGPLGRPPSAWGGPSYQVSTWKDGILDDTSAHESSRTTCRELKKCLSPKVR